VIRWAQINEVCYSEISWTYLNVLFESLFCFMKLLNMAMVRNFEVMTRHELNHCVEFCNFVQCHIRVKYLS
jgi:hypothetical protein